MVTSPNLEAVRARLIAGGGRGTLSLKKRRPQPAWNLYYIYICVQICSSPWPNGRAQSRGSFPPPFFSPRPWMDQYQGGGGVGDDG